MVCCDQPMTRLVANTVDASAEKHVPYVTRKDGKIYVQVGSEPHPMIPEHYIQWIVMVTDKTMVRVALSPNDEPKLFLTIWAMLMFMNTAICTAFGRQR